MEILNIYTDRGYAKVSAMFKFKLSLHLQHTLKVQLRKEAGLQANPSLEFSVDSLNRIYGESEEAIRARTKTIRLGGVQASSARVTTVRGRWEQTSL